MPNVTNDKEHEHDDPSSFHAEKKMLNINTPRNNQTVAELKMMLVKHWRIQNPHE